MISELGDIDRKIIKTISKGDNNIASISRSTGFAQLTVVTHVKKLIGNGFVKNKWIIRGAKEYYNLTLTENGKAIK